VKTQLLCTFAHLANLNIVTEYIQQNYDIPERRIFVFSADTNPNSLYCTYTLYTVNALNEVIRAVNNGLLDKSFQIDWTHYQNSFILTNDNGYRVISLVFVKRISW